MHFQLIAPGHAVAGNITGIYQHFPALLQPDLPELGIRPILRVGIQVTAQDVIQVAVGIHRIAAGKILCHRGRDILALLVLQFVQTANIQARILHGDNTHGSGHRRHQGQTRQKNGQKL